MTIEKYFEVWKNKHHQDRPKFELKKNDSFMTSASFGRDNLLTLLTNNQFFFRLCIFIQIKNVIENRCPKIVKYFNFDNISFICLFKKKSGKVVHRGVGTGTSIYPLSCPVYLPGRLIWITFRSQMKCGLEALTRTAWLHSL